MKNSLPSESSENTVLDEIQYGESNGGNRFSIGRSMTKLCITSDSSLKNSWAAHGPGNSNRLEIVFEELFWSKRLFADKIRSERMNFTEI